MITEEILENLQCAVSDEEHFFIDPITLSNCGHSICQSCIQAGDTKIKCKICNLITNQDFSKVEISQGSKMALNLCLSEIFQILEKETSWKLNDFKSICLKNNNKFKNEVYFVKMI